MSIIRLQLPCEVSFAESYIWQKCIAELYKSSMLNNSIYVLLPQNERAGFFLSQKTGISNKVFYKNYKKMLTGREIYNILKIDRPSVNILNGVKL